MLYKREPSFRLRKYWILLLSLAVLQGCQKTSARVNLSEKESVHDAKSYDANIEHFVKVNDGIFMLDGKPYKFVGTNMWYGAYLGSPDESVGNRQRLKGELDLMLSLGITNIRLLGASEKSPLRDAISPAINMNGEDLNESLLEGLDFLLNEMHKRDMKAVIYLNNFWEWSGGMAAYLSWTQNGNIVDPADPATPWPAFALFASQFYSDENAMSLFHRYIKTLLSRKNTVNGRLYRSDPTIMAWQLANEPRPGNGVESQKNLEAYYDWIARTAVLIDSLAPLQLISVGSEGTMGCLGLRECVIRSHQVSHIDYMTVHMWLKNWGWYDVAKPEDTFASALIRADQYIEQHIEIAKQLGMPLVLEEFGLERDGGLFTPESSANYRQQYFNFVFRKLEANSAHLMGSNFWAWGGFGRAEHTDAVWRNGDLSYLGDPPQEPQGLNSVYSSDEGMLRLIKSHSEQLRESVNR